MTLSRFSWEGLQTMVGAGAGLFAATCLHVDAIEHYGGTTVIRCWRKDKYWGGVCFGSVILGDCRIAAQPGNALFMHEYGHTLQSRASGPLYLFKYGLPSVVSRHSKRQHNQHPVEQDANLRAFQHFGSSTNVDWSHERHPLPASGLPLTPRWWEYVPPIFPVVTVAEALMKR